MKRGVILLCSLALIVLFGACSKTNAKNKTTDPLIGLSMPTHSDESWIRHSSFTIQYLKEMGYTQFD